MNTVPGLNESGMIVNEHMPSANNYRTPTNPMAQAPGSILNVH